MEVKNSIMGYSTGLSFYFKQNDSQASKRYSRFKINADVPGTDDLLATSNKEHSTDVVDAYMKMSQDSALKKNEVTASAEPAVRAYGAVEEIDPETVSKNRQAIGMTSYPVSDMLSNVVIAFVPPESTAKDPIVQISMEESDGKHTYNIHVNEVDTKSATEMEMFAYLSYQGYIGNKIPNALNNYSAYKGIRYQDEFNIYGEFKELMGENYFTSVKSNAEAMINRVYSWMKNIDQPDAKKQAEWCEKLLEMLESPMKVL